MRALAWSLLVTLPLAAAGCRSRSDAPAPASEAVNRGVARLERRAEPDPAFVATVPGTPVRPAPAPAAARELERLDALLAKARGLDAEELLEGRAPPFRPYPGAEGEAVGLDLLQNSALRLTEEEAEALRANGFVVSRRQPFPSFLYGYQSIYAQDLPVYVSADSILHAVHRSFESVLGLVEETAIRPELRALLAGMRRRLEAGRADRFGATARSDADLVLAVALRVLEGDRSGEGGPVVPVAGATPEEFDRLVAAVVTGNSTEDVELFGARRRIDFSQFRPRGHYLETAGRQRYFRAMMWLGRLELRLLETEPDGDQSFHRRQLEAALALRALLDDDARRRLSRIDRRLAAFVGPRDDLAVEHLDALARRMGLDERGALARATDQALATEILRLAEGLGRVSSQLVLKEPRVEGTLPPGASFLLLGQRRSPDAEVLSNVVHDRAGGGTVKRWMPDPLDVAYAVLGNDQAVAHLESELRRHPYAADLERMRVLLDEDFARAPSQARSLREAWLLALRELSPSPGAKGLPKVARSELWGRRLLSTQLASWAELRHGTVLYDEQSYTTGALCDYPDGYVDPYPGFYAALRRWTDLARAALDDVELERAPQLRGVVAWLARLDEALAVLEEMAGLERRGEPLRPEHIAFLNRAVAIRPPEGCGALPRPEGWFAELYLDPSDAQEFAPVVCDVHTQPTDAAGEPIGRILHVATGAPRLMAVLIDSSSGPHVYVGLASAYHERITRGFERLHDRAWAEGYWDAPPADPPWARAFLVGTFEKPEGWRTEPLRVEPPVSGAR